MLTSWVNIDIKVMVIEYSHSDSLFYKVREHSVFTLDEDQKFHMMYGSESSSNPAQIEANLEDIAKQVQQDIRLLFYKY
jgi:hypothetical protein